MTPQEHWQKAIALLAAIDAPTPEWKEAIGNLRKTVDLLIAEVHLQSIALQVKDRRIAELEAQIGRIYAAHEASRRIRSSGREPQLPRFSDTHLSSFEMGEK